MSDEVEVLKHVYDRFNARDMEIVLAAMQEDVIWAKWHRRRPCPGTRRSAQLLTRQWAMIDPHVEPVAFATVPKGKWLSKSIRSCATQRESSRG